VPSTQLATI